MVEKDMIRR